MPYPKPLSLEAVAEHFAGRYVEAPAEVGELPADDPQVQLSERMIAEDRGRSGWGYAHSDWHYYYARFHHEPTTQNP